MSVKSACLRLTETDAKTGRTSGLADNEHRTVNLRKRLLSFTTDKQAANTTHTAACHYHIVNVFIFSKLNDALPRCFTVNSHNTARQLSSFSRFINHAQALLNLFALALTANLINEFFLPFSVKYKGVPF